jgi:hypothetical protein
MPISIKQKRAKEKAWRQANRERVRANSRAWQQANPKKRANSHLKHTYGITLDDYEKMLAKQEGRCAICRTDRPGGSGKFHVDHDHKTGTVRGLLCMRCNHTLGAFELLRAEMLSYLTTTGANHVGRI